MSSGQPNPKRSVAAAAKANDNLILAFHMAQTEADETELEFLCEQFRLNTNMMYKVSALIKNDMRDPKNQFNL